ncbi:MAG: hypothetical protein C4549_06505 [Deltaproteobacteria bacterium]|nr:MAG: hypothetical protein C4549_06505 [Deltaproteobacteria bacterium]
MWNSLLGYTADFEREIVVSNAKERQKSKINYLSSIMKCNKRGSNFDWFFKAQTFSGSVID